MEPSAKRGTYPTYTPLNQHSIPVRAAWVRCNIIMAGDASQDTICIGRGLLENTSKCVSNPCLCLGPYEFLSADE